MAAGNGQLDVPGWLDQLAVLKGNDANCPPLFSAEILYSVNRFPAVEGSIIQISSAWNLGLVRSQLEKSLRFDSRNHHDRIHSLKLFAPKNDQKWMVGDSQFSGAMSWLVSGRVPFTKSLKLLS